MQPQGSIPMDSTTAAHLFQALHAESEVLWSFLCDVRELLSARERVLGEAHDQYLRILAWSRSLTKLNEPADFQAIASGCRALFELAIDVVLLCRRKDAGDRVRGWEKSAIYKHAAWPDSDSPTKHDPRGEKGRFPLTRISHQRKCIAKK
jgi:hypothetical protein